MSHLPGAVRYSHRKVKGNKAGGIDPLLFRAREPAAWAALLGSGAAEVFRRLPYPVSRYGGALDRAQEEGTPFEGSWFRE